MFILVSVVMRTPVGRGHRAGGWSEMTSGTSLEAVVIPVSVLIGLFVGSFLNVVVVPGTPRTIGLDTPIVLSDV